MKCLIKEFPNKYFDLAAKEAPDSEEEGADWIFRLQTIYILQRPICTDMYSSTQTARTVASGICFHFRCVINGDTRLRLAVGL